MTGVEVPPVTDPDRVLRAVRSVGSALGRAQVEAREASRAVRDDVELVRAAQADAVRALDEIRDRLARPVWPATWWIADAPWGDTRAVWTTGPTGQKQLVTTSSQCPGPVWQQLVRDLPDRGACITCTALMLCPVHEGDLDELADGDVVEVTLRARVMVAPDGRQAYMIGPDTEPLFLWAADPGVRSVRRVTR